MLVDLLNHAGPPVCHTPQFGALSWKDNFTREEIGMFHLLSLESAAKTEVTRGWKKGFQSRVCQEGVE